MTVRLKSLSEAERVQRPTGQIYFFPIADGLPDLPMFADVIALYGQKRGGAGLPARSSFDFKDLRGWHANICLSLFSPDHSDGEVRILGEVYRTLFDGVLWPGMKLSETRHPEMPDLVQYFRGILTRPAIGYFTGTLPHEGREHVRADIVDMPLADESGVGRYVLSFMRDRTQFPSH